MPSTNESFTTVGDLRSVLIQTNLKTGVSTTSTTITPNRISSSGSKARTSMLTPGYGLKKIMGQLPENDFSFSETTRTGLRGYESSVWYSGLNNSTRNEQTLSGIFSPPVYSVPFSSSVMTLSALNQSNLVKAKVSGKIKDSTMDLAVSAGESKETWKLFSDTTRYISKGVSAARKGDASAVISALGIKDLSTFDGVSKKSANAWLMFNYGIKPLISDLENGLKAYQKGLLKERYSVHASGSSYNDSIVKQYVSGNYDYVENWTLKQDVTCRVKYEVTNGQLATISSLGLSNPLSLGWELTKLSFVVDWMIGVGDWLSQVDSSLGKSFKGGSITQFRKIKLLGSRSNYLPKSIYTSFSGSAVWSFESVDCSRSLLASWPIAYLPAFQDKIGLSQVATSVALLRQLKH